MAYHRLEGVEIAGLVSRSLPERTDLPDKLVDYPRYSDYTTALEATIPEAVSINTWPDTHAGFALQAFQRGCHVFMEKPIATNIIDAERVVAAAIAAKRKLVLGDILRVHPSWQKFIEIGRTLGKPLVMRMNLNQQSSGEAYVWHRNLLDSLTPIVDCGAHYVDVMCQLTGARPVRVHGIGAQLWTGAPRPNYGHLHVTFDDGSLGWYEAGWGPMMSEVAFFVKDVVGPKGCVSIVASESPAAPDQQGLEGGSADIDEHTKASALRVHYAQTDSEHRFTRPDEVLNMADEPDHQALCEREQQWFIRAMQEDIDLGESMNAALDSLRIVLAADESMRTGRVVNL